MIHCSIEDTWDNVQLLLAQGLEPLVENYFRNHGNEEKEYHLVQSKLHLICNAIRAMDVPRFAFVIRCYKAKLRAELEVCSTFRDLDAHTFLINAYVAIAAGREHEVAQPLQFD
jgi:hypothetical protein